MSRREADLSRREFLKATTKAGVGFAALGGPQRSGAAQHTVPAEDAPVWAIDDTDKVHPISGNLLSEGLEVYAGRSPSQGTYREKNSIWDAATQTVKLVAGRNEFVAFQVVIEPRGEDLHKILVDPTDLLGARERINADRDIRVFKELYVRQTPPSAHPQRSSDGEWYPDPIVPFEIAGTAPFELPDASGPFPEQRVQPIWVDIYVAHDLPPGTYTGQINILHINIRKLAILKVELEVGNFTLPDKLGLDVDLMNYGSLNVERGWPDLVIDSKRNWAIEREFFRMAHAHRMTFAICPYNYDDVIPKGLKPEIAGVGDTIHVQNWKSWDERYGPILSGEAFADLPRGPEPVDHFNLPFSLMWPADFRSWGKPSYRMETIRIAKEFRDHLSGKGWTKPLYEIYYNDGESSGFEPFNLDEANREEDFEALRALGSILQVAYPSGGPLRVVFREDLSEVHNKGAIRTAWRLLGPLVGLWNMYDPDYWANMPLVRELKSQGKIVFFYHPAPPVLEPLIKSVFWGWKGYKYEADGFCFWNTTDWNDYMVNAAPVDPYTNADTGQQGRSMLLYPGYKFGYDGPIPSIRFKALRRGLQDFEYLRLMEKSGKKTHAELVQMADDLLLGKTVDYPGLHRSAFELLAE